MQPGDVYRKPITTKYRNWKRATKRSYRGTSMKTKTQTHIRPRPANADSTFRLGRIVSDCAFRLSSALGHSGRAGNHATFGSKKIAK